MIGKQPSKQKLHTAASDWQSSEQGFTIIESLVAILVVGILLVAIAPVLSLSVATRVQARRVELASQAARSYIDAVRTKKINPPAGTSTTTNLSTFDAPTATGTLSCTANSYCTAPSAPTGTSLYCLDFDNSGSCTTNSPVDMIVHAFRPNNNDAKQGYALGIRVYRADAFKTSTTLLKSTSTARATQNSYTQGAGGRIAPLLEMTTEINDTVPVLNDLCTRLGGCS